jgi:predicted negative regulator of RcsB-dependent stress response
MMAVYDLEEQEKIDELKAWWKQYGKLVVSAVVAVAIGFAGVQGWRYWQMKQSVEAGDLYAQLKQAAESGEPKKAADIAAALIDKYPRTGYATYAGLVGAKIAFDSGDNATAKTRLSWVIEHARDEGTRDVARLRLATVLLDEKQYDEAMKVLDNKPSEPFAALFADLRGDVLVAEGKISEARAAYQLALDKSDPSSALRSVVQMKRDALGDAK